MTKNDWEGISVLGLFGAILAGIAGWLTHIFVVISVLTSSTSAGISVGYGILLFMGLFFPPIGSLHGIGVWFGVW